MDNKRHLRPSFINVALFLWTKNVNGLIESIRHLHFEANCYCKEGFFRLTILSGLPPLFLVDMFHVNIGGFDIWWFPYFLVAQEIYVENYLLYWIFKVLGMGIRLTNLGIQIKVMSFKELVWFGTICDPSIVLAMNILLTKLPPRPPLVIRSNSLISFMLVVNP
jgi:hypothetical protein